MAPNGSELGPGHTPAQGMAPSILATADMMGVDAPSRSTTAPRASIFCLRPSAHALPPWAEAGQRAGLGMLCALGHDTGLFPLGDGVTLEGTAHTLPGRLDSPAWHSLLWPPAPSAMGCKEQALPWAMARRRARNQNSPKTPVPRQPGCPRMLPASLFAAWYQRARGGGWCPALGGRRAGLASALALHPAWFPLTTDT